MALKHGIEGEGPATTPKVLATLGLRPAHLSRRGRGPVGCCRLRLPAARGDLPGARGPVPPAAAARVAHARERDRPRAQPVRRAALDPGRVPLHLSAAARSERDAARQPRALIFKGVGGEAQRNPEKPCRTRCIDGGTAAEIVWPALTEGEPWPWRRGALEPERLVGLWRGEWQAPGPVAAVVGTTAMALGLLGRAPTVEQAEALASRLWQDRPRSRYRPG